MDGEWVLDAQENEIGRFGGPFRLGGGIVPFLHKDLGFKEPDHTEIQAQCPGRYWIVGIDFGHFMQDSRPPPGEGRDSGAPQPATAPPEHSR